MNLDKLKEMARRCELREEWQRAIEAYHRVAGALSDAGEPVDPALYNRIGDLEIKTGDSEGALQAYRRAADLYAEQGFFNNAIALCGKILRVDPGQVQTYLRLAELHARKNVIPEARRNLVEFVDRMMVVRQQEKAVEALKSFAVRFGASPELLHTLTELLKKASGAPDAHDTLEQLVGSQEAAPGAGEAGPGEPHRVESGAAPVRGLVFIDLGLDIPGLPDLLSSDTGRGSAATEDGREGRGDTAGKLSTEFGPTLEPPDPGVALSGYEATILEELPSAESFEIEPLLLTPEPDYVEVPGLEARLEFGFDTVDRDVPRLSVEPLFAEALSIEAMSLGQLSEAPVVAAPPPGLVGAISPEPIGIGAEALFDTVEMDVADHIAVLAETASIPDLERALATCENAQDWLAALRVGAALIQREPDSVARHQKRVELAYHANDWQLLISAYLGLADVLARRGTAENAVLVYRRVLDHDPENPEALAALAALRPAAPAPGQPLQAGGEDFVDLGALILDPEPERDTRMRVEETEPVGDEDKDFLETLAQFKEGIAANIDAEDFQAHYDLGIAFKEMGLLDEAIAQFQKALRAPEGRLKTSEALGIAFFEKGRHSIAEAVLSRAVEALPGADDEKIALLYWLGRSVEAQGRARDAMRWYERAMAVDITFFDVSDRLRQLVEGEHSA